MYRTTGNGVRTGPPDRTGTGMLPACSLGSVTSRLPLRHSLSRRCIGMLGQSVDGAGTRSGRRAERGTPLIRGDFVGIVGIAPVLSVFGGLLDSRYCVLYVLYYINIIPVLNIMEPWRRLLSTRCKLVTTALRRSRS